MNKDMNKGWVFKRNYTFPFANQGEGNFWGATTRTMVKDADTTLHDDAENMLCAVNIFNEEYYKWPQSSDNSPVHNGVCFTSNFTPQRRARVGRSRTTILPIVESHLQMIWDQAQPLLSPPRDRLIPCHVKRKCPGYAVFTMNDAHRFC
jgi:hypothetical protein